MEKHRLRQKQEAEQRKYEQRQLKKETSTYRTPHLTKDWLESDGAKKRTARQKEDDGHDVEDDEDEDEDEDEEDEDVEDDEDEEDEEDEEDAEEDAEEDESDSSEDESLEKRDLPRRRAVLSDDDDER